MWSEQGRDGPTKVGRRSRFVSARRSKGEAARERAVYPTRFKHECERDLLQIRAKKTGLRNQWFRQSYVSKPTLIVLAIPSTLSIYHRERLDIAVTVLQRTAPDIIVAMAGRTHHAVDRLSISTPRHADALHYNPQHASSSLFGAGDTPMHCTPCTVAALRCAILGSFA